MKTKQLFLIAALAIVFVSCKKNEKGADAKAGVVIDTAAIAADSIKKSQQAELELFKQDSIEALQIKGYSVKKISGKQKYSGEKTTVIYISLSQYIKELNEDAKREMWTKAELESTIAKYKKYALGGIVELKIERSTIGAANTDMFTVIIKDSADIELYREELESRIPNTPNGSDNWWNVGSAFLPRRIQMPFYIYVVDKLADAPYKYEVTPIKN